MEKKSRRSIQKINRFAIVFIELKQKISLFYTSNIQSFEISSTKILKLLFEKADVSKKKSVPLQTELERCSSG